MIKRRNFLKQISLLSLVLFLSKPISNVFREVVDDDFEFILVTHNSDCHFGVDGRWKPVSIVITMANCHIKGGLASLKVGSFVTIIDCRGGKGVDIFKGYTTFSTKNELRLSNRLPSLP